MRKLIFGLLLGSMFFNVNGQKISFSVYADPQFSWFSSDEEKIEPNGSVLHINTGIEFNYFFHDNYALMAAIGINNTGGNLLYSDTTIFIAKEESLEALPGTNLKHRLQYLNLPLGLTLKTEELGYLTFSFQGGFMPMININAHATSDDRLFERESIRENINLFNLNYFVGISAIYRLGGRTAVIGGLRWSSGFTDVTGNDKVNINLNAISLHIAIQF
ncbi:MAG: outer membrane beta-barrel protein [Bacteroidales bacterium]|nr:outer membrane beta-barrel protein [Bacteroidales bacterium]MBN2698998.1 outer membrane beta-barrel protein [Bacteroidales bacterium]